MSDALPLSMGLGLVVSLLFGEAFGLSAGGMIVPGYFALGMGQPLDLLLTLGAAGVTYLFVEGVSRVVILYGRRRVVLTLLLGFVVGELTRVWASGVVLKGNRELHVVGFIIPGLIALGFARRGALETVATLACASAVVRLVLIGLGLGLVT